MSKKKTKSKKTETINETPIVEEINEGVNDSIDTQETIEPEVTEKEETADESTTPVQEIDPKILQEEKERREAIKNDTIQRQKIRIIRDKYYR